MGERADRGRERPLRGVIEAAVVALQPRARHAELGPRVEQRAEQLERSRGDPRVRVEDQHVGSGAGADREVVGCAESRVARVAGQAHLAELAFDHLRGPVAGGVVDHVHGHRPLAAGARAASAGSRATAPESERRRSPRRVPGARTRRPDASFNAFMGDPRIVFVSREVYPFDSAGLGNYVLFTAAALASVAEVTILTSGLHERRYRELARRRRPAAAPGGPLRVRPRARASRRPRIGMASLHLWSARAYRGAGAAASRTGDRTWSSSPTTSARRASRCRRPRPSTRGCATRWSACARTRARRCARCSTATCPTDRDARHLHELERFALRHADRFLWPGGDVLGAYRAFYGKPTASPAADPRPAHGHAGAGARAAARSRGASFAFSTSGASSGARACRT